MEVASGKLRQHAISFFYIVFGGAMSQAPVAELS